MIAKLKNWLDACVTLLQKYPTQVHIFFVAWNAFVTSWATKIAVPLDVIGIPLTINASAIVSWLQLHMHASTKIVIVVTFLVNATIAYTTWKKKHIEVINVPVGSIVIAQPPVVDTLAAAEKIDNVKVQVNDISKTTK
jgi:hypothetical protein